MYRSILVGQDGSQGGLKALEQAIWIANKTRAHLTLIHLYSRKLPLATVQSQDLNEAEELLNQRAVICKSAGVSCSTQVVCGWTTQALVAESRWHDLVVVGKHGLNWNGATSTLGSVPTAMLASSAVPVLVSDENAAFPPRLLVVFDESPDACLALRISAGLGIERGLKLRVIEVVKRGGSSDKLQRARRYLDGCEGLEVNVERLVGGALELTIEYIDRHGISLTYLPAMDRSLSGHKLTSAVATQTPSSLIVPQGRVPPIY